MQCSFANKQHAAQLQCKPGYITGRPTRKATAQRVCIVNASWPAQNLINKFLNRDHKRTRHGGSHEKDQSHQFKDAEDSSGTTDVSRALAAPISPFNKKGRKGQWRVNQWPVAEVLGKNFLFFEAQESGRLRSGHRIKWRGNSYLNDKWNNRKLDGGWFDAGDHLKLVYPMCWTVAHMAWSMSDGKQLLKETRYDGISNWDAAVRSLDHALDFLFRCRIKAGQFVSQVGEVEADHSNCYRAELDDQTPRTSYSTSNRRGGSDLLFQASAAFAASAVALRGERDEGSKRNRKRAEEYAKLLFEEAQQQAPSIYSQSEPENAKTYLSDSWEHTAFWAAAWMYRLTGKDSYKKLAKEYQYGAEKKSSYWMSHHWANVYFGACLIMWEETGRPRSRPGDDHGFEHQLGRLADAHLDKTGGIKRTPKELTYVDKWGTLRHACGVAWVLAGYARGLRRKGRGSSADKKRADDLMWFSERQVTYAMGAAGRSFIVGFGNNPPRQPHHRNAALLRKDSNNWDVFNNIKRPNAHTITGALVGGPGLKDDYTDRRNDYEKNEVAVDYNGALLAALVQTAMAYND